MTDAELQAIREREAKATPGPWEWDRERDRIVETSERRSVIRPSVSFLYSGIDGLEDDLLFAAASRADIPALLTEIDRLRLALAGEEKARELTCQRCKGRGTCNANPGVDPAYAPCYVCRGTGKRKEQQP